MRVALAVVSSLLVAGLAHPRPAHAGLTSTVGAESGSKAIMSCPQGMLMYKIHAVSDATNHVLKHVAFRCKGTAPDGSTTSYETGLVPSLTGPEYGNRPPDGSATCPTGQVLDRIDFRGTNGRTTGISTVQCQSTSGAATGLRVNAGGEGSAVLGSLVCPSYEGLRQIELWLSSDSIIGMRGSCAFIGVPPIAVQVDRTLTPKPSAAVPVSIGPGRKQTFSFTIIGASQESTPFFVQAETPAEDGGSTNAPRFRIDAARPGGAIVLSQEVTLQPTQSGTTFSLTLNSTGFWQIVIVNLKSPTGKLAIKRLGPDRN